MKKLISIEDQIIQGVINDLLCAGYKVSVFDGEETTVSKSGNPGLIFTAMKSTEEDYLFASREGELDGWVRFIYGNDDIEVINDYTTSLDHVMAGIDLEISDHNNREGGVN